MRKLKKFWQHNKIGILLALLLLGGGFLRFYNADWADGFMLHPDERNVARAVIDLDFKNGDFNPNFYAYGALPIYILHALVGPNFDAAIIAGRHMSAVFATLVILLTYFITKDALVLAQVEAKTARKLSLLAAGFVTFLPGLIQFAHFMTFETFLTFEYLLFVYLCLRHLRTRKVIFIILAAIVIGAAIATKIVSLALLPLLFITLFVGLDWLQAKGFKHKARLILLRWLPGSLISLLLVVIFAFISSPYTYINSYIQLPAGALGGIFDCDSSQAAVVDCSSNGKSIIEYERGLADGTQIIFYTEQFQNTVPGVYQVSRVFPYILGVHLLILFVFALIAILIIGLKQALGWLLARHEFRYAGIMIVLGAIIGYTALHLPLYVKWTRYMIPILPFMVVLAVFFVWQIAALLPRWARALLTLKLLVFLGLSVCQGLNFFSAYLETDSRIESAAWAAEYIDPQARLLVEDYDINILPWNAKLNVANMTSFNTYDLDNEYVGDQKLIQLYALLDDVDYIVLPSSRVYSSRLRNPERFPNGHQYFSELFAGELGFELVGEWRRETWQDKILQAGGWQSDVREQMTSPLAPDETYYVFDRPTVLVFKKTR